MITKKKYSEEVFLIIKGAFLCLTLTIIFGVCSIFIEWIKFTFIFSLIMGFLTNVLCFQKTNYFITRILNGEFTNPKKVMIINVLTNYLIYAIILILNIYFSFFSIIFTIIGIFIIKTIIVITHIKLPKGR